MKLYLVLHSLNSFLNDVPLTLHFFNVLSQFNGGVSAVLERFQLFMCCFEGFNLFIILEKNKLKDMYTGAVAARLHTPRPPYCPRIAGVFRETCNGCRGRC